MSAINPRLIMLRVTGYGQIGPNRDKPGFGTLGAWRSSLLAGFMGAAASAGWFTAMAMQPVTHVRTLGLVELLFSYAVSWRMFRERFGVAEHIGLAFLVLGLAAVLNVL